MNMTNVTKVAILGALLWAAWKYGPAEVKGAALGVAGLVAVNQIPMVRDGLDVRLVA